MGLPILTLTLKNFASPFKKSYFTVDYFAAALSAAFYAGSQLLRGHSRVRATAALLKTTTAEKRQNCPVCEAHLGILAHNFAEKNL